MTALTSPGKRFLRGSLARFGLEIRRLPGGQIDPLCEGFGHYLVEASKAGQDVNDWIEEKLGWEAALPVLQTAVLPFVRSESRICEIGPGTGRHARHLVPILRDGQLHLFDHSPWIREFLAGYFSAAPRVHIHDCDGASLSLPERSVDLCLSFGTFIELKLGAILLLAREFARVLIDGGRVIFDYIDISREEGRRYLEQQAAAHPQTFTYHCGHTIDEVFMSVGFLASRRHQDGKSTYVVFEKRPSTPMLRSAAAPTRTEEGAQPGNGDSR